MEVYKHRFFMIDFDNICTILKNIYKTGCMSDYLLKNYTLIMSKEDEELAKYINDEINVYIQIILNENAVKIIDEEVYALKIINNNDLDDAIREKYIELLETNIINLKEINNNSLWSKFLDKGIIDYNAKNLLDYFFCSGNGLDDILIKFINSFKNEIIFDSSKIKERYGEDSTSDLFVAIVNSNKINDSKYEEMLKKFNRYDESFCIKDIETNKVNILIKLNIIRMNAKTLNFIRENYSSNLIEYIVSNIEEYLANTLSKDNFEYEEMIQLLDTGIDEDKKIKLIKYTNKSISIIDKNYSDKIKKYILENNFDDNNIEYLINKFKYEKDEIKEVIRKLISNHIDIILQIKISIEYEEMSCLLNDEELDYEIKRKLFISGIDNMKKDEIYECFKLLGMSEYLAIFNQQEVVYFQNTKINKLFLESLKFKEIIKDYEEATRDGDEYLAVDLENNIIGE